MIGLVGSSGIIGSVLHKSISFDMQFNSSNIEDISKYKFDILYCAAPSSNRLLANRNPVDDLENIRNLVFQLQKTLINKLILISTVDTILKNSNYAINRLYLEKQLFDRFNCTIIRLPSLVGKEIKKNPLYDLKNNQFISDIKGFDYYQWYPLSHLVDDITNVGIENKAYNFVSEPIQTVNIVKRFRPENVDLIKHFQENVYDIKPYMYSSDEIFEEMQRYFQ